MSERFPNDVDPIETRDWLGRSNRSSVKKVLSVLSI